MKFSRFWKCLNTTWNSPEQPVVYPCDSFLINNCNMTGSSVESNVLLCWM